MKVYTGIGSRKTPDWALSLMTGIAGALEKLGYTLRSGGASGADTAFEMGIKNHSNMEIYLPWSGFENRVGTGYIIANAETMNKAIELTAPYHDNWGNLSIGVKKLMGRNYFQIMGLTLDTQTNFVICYTDNGELVGGTAQAIKIAASKNIPIFNIGKYNTLELAKTEFVKFYESAKQD